MKCKILLEIMMISFIVFVTNGYSESVGSYTPSAAMFRLVSSGISEESVDEYTSQLRFLLGEYTGWDIMNHQVTKDKIRRSGGEWFCSKPECAIINGQHLNVDYAIFGTLQTVGKSITIGIQIADVSSGRVVSDVSEFHKGRESSFISKTLPKVADKLYSDVRNIDIAKRELISETKDANRAVIQDQAKNSAFDDVRGYLSYKKDDPLSEISPEGKMAFGYLMIGANLSDDDALRYSYQLQSYLSIAGAHNMLYIDEMELLMQVKGGDLKCPNRREAVRIGRLLGVDFMGYGKLTRFFRIYKLRTKIVNVETGKNVEKTRKRYRGQADVFLTKVIPTIASQLGDAFFNNSEFSISKDRAITTSPY